MTIHAMQWIDAPDKYEVPACFIKHRFYLFRRADGKTYFAKRLNFKLIHQMMNHEGELTCFFGGMSKEIYTTKNAFLSVAPTVNSRTPCKVDWWTNNNRFFAADLDPQFPPHTPYDLSYPKGYDPVILSRA